MPLLAQGPQQPQQQQQQPIGGLGVTTGLMLTALALFSSVESPVGWASVDAPATPLEEEGGQYRGPVK